MKASKPILVVDDDPFIVEFLKTVLEASGYQVVTASDGREALERLRSTLPGLILLDMAMPVVDGFEFLRRLRNHHHISIPVVVMTAMDDAHLLSRKLGTEGWLQKPFDLDTLLDAVDRLLL